MSTYDPRAGLPSPSIMHRVSECSGSVAMVNALRSSGKYIAISNPYAPSGNRVHWHLARTNGQNENQTENDLTADELIVARKCKELANKTIEAWRDNECEYLEFIVEKRLWYRNGLIPRFSGQPDLVVIGENNRALVINYKTGRLEAEPAADNLQLRAEIVLLKHTRPALEQIDAAIVEPLVSWDSERVSYSAKNLAQAETEILAIVDEASWNHKRTAGPWCVHCPARANCREALDYIQTIPNPEAGNGIIELPRGEAGTQLWEKIKLAKKLLETLEQTYTKILEDEPGALPGFILPKEGREVRYVADPQKFKAALAEYLTAEQIDGCADYRLTRISEMIGMKLNIAGKDLERLFDQLTKNVIGTRRDRPFIRPLTKREREEMKAKAEITEK